MPYPGHIIGVVGACLTLACGGGRGLPAGASPAASAAFESCSVLEGNDRQDCYQEHVLGVLADEGVRPALDMLAAVATADVNVEREAHVYTHAVGITSYDARRPVSEVFSECTELFQSGCYHGVIQAHLMAAGVSDDATVTELCEDFKPPGSDRFLLFQCLHGLGHGLTMFYGYDLPRALEGCDLLAESWDRQSCYGGAFMENITGATDPHHVATELGRSPDSRHADAEDPEAATHDHEMQGEKSPDMIAKEGLEPWEPLRADDPHYPCSVLDSRYLAACYMMQTSVMLHHNGDDFGAAADDCGRAPERWRATCFQSLGRDISAYTLQDQGKGLEACGRTPEDFRDACYVGLVKNFVDLTATTEDGFEFCTRVEERYKGRCNEAIGEQINTLFATEEERREACSMAETDDLEATCLFGARVPAL
ncbi:MAG: hypothetical protein ACC682_04790 [Gemmatimonadota bacterium]